MKLRNWSYEKHINLKSVIAELNYEKRYEKVTDIVILKPLKE